MKPLLSHHITRPACRPCFIYAPAFCRSPKRWELFHPRGWPAGHESLLSSVSPRSDQRPVLAEIVVSPGADDSGVGVANKKCCGAASRLTIKQNHTVAGCRDVRKTRYEGIS